MVIECRSLIILIVVIVVFVEKKIRYFLDKFIKKYINIKEKGFYWIFEGEIWVEVVI